MKIIAAVFLPLFFLSIRPAAATEAVHISANVKADVFINGKKVGTTPLLLPQGGKTEIVLFKSGYEPATILHTATRKEGIMTSTSGDPPREEFLMADDRFGMGVWCSGRDSVNFQTSYETCVIVGSSTYFPTAFASVMPSEATRFALPYRAEEYAPQQIYVYMIKSKDGETNTNDWALRRFVISNFGDFVIGRESHFLTTVSRMTDLTNEQIKEIIVANPTPDAAANAIAERAGGKK